MWILYFIYGGITAKIVAIKKASGGIHGNRTCGNVVNDLEKARDFFIKYLDGKSNDGYKVLSLIMENKNFT